MHKLIAILMGIALIGCFSLAKAEVLTDTQLSGIYAGQIDTDINDDVTATFSAVSSQKNIAAIGSLEGGVSGSQISNQNLAEDVSNLGDSAVASQTNIAAIAGLGTAASDNNTIANTNNARVTNEVAVDSGSAELSLEGSSISDAGVNSILSTVTALQSAVASQNNIGAVVGGGSVTGTTISNSNSATVSNTPAL